MMFFCKKVIIQRCSDTPDMEGAGRAWSEPYSYGHYF